MIPTSIETLGDAIRWARRERKLSLRGMAEGVGFSAPFLSDLEHGKRRTSRLPEIAALLRVDLVELESFDGRVPADLREWLIEHPRVVAHLRGLRDGRAPAKLLRELGLR